MLIFCAFFFLHDSSRLMFLNEISLMLVVLVGLYSVKIVSVFCFVKVR